MKENLFLLFLLCFLISCGTKDNSSEHTIKDTLVSGNVLDEDLPVNKIISNLTCSVGGYHYSVFLPSAYDNIKKFPAIIFFDPHAKADLPLEKYQNLSNRYGYILLSSGDSKNGLQPNLYAEIYKALKDELLSKYKVQSDRVYCAGFSGGARVAINIGLSDKNIAGVIANSAGFEPSRSPITSDFVFAGIAGNEDFNLLEQRRTEKSLQELPASHLFIEFDGKHEWAPESSMEYAFVFLESSARLKSKSLFNHSVSTSFIEGQIKKVDELTNKWERYLLLKKIKSLLYDNLQIEKYSNEIMSLEKSSEIKMHLKLMEETNAQESVLQSNYYNKVFTETILWWEKEVKSMEKETADREKYLMYKRIKSYLSLAVYMTLISPQAKQDVILLEKLTEIYALVDPENPEWAYQKALLRARQGNLEEAEFLIKKSLELGFDDKGRFFSQPEFYSFQSKQEIISRFK